MERKKTLLERYEIPLGHLDFAYVPKCNDAREMEHIVQILRSGEEGYFPDLTRCAEDRLRELKPGSKLFRVEEWLRGRESLAPDEWKPIYDWTHQIKGKDNKLAELKDKETEGAAELELPPIRKGGKIGETTRKEEEAGGGDRVATTKAKASKRIKSTDYRKWDKYDADEELLRMELAEERVQEEVERKNRLNLQKSSHPPKIIELDAADDATGRGEHRDLAKKLTDVEREQLAEEYRLRGNEYFRAKEYESAVSEYGRSIQMNAATAAPAFNNRAIAYIKMQRFLEAIADCDRCLQLEPHNLKAWLRKAEASYGHGRRREAYDIYLKALELDPSNAVALKATAELRPQLGELPPPGATRLHIQEDPPQSTKAVGSSTKGSTTSTKESTASTTKTTTTLEDPPTSKQSTVKVVPPKAKVTAPPPPKDYDLADLIVPKHVVKNKLTAAAAALSQKMQKPSKPPEGVKSSLRHSPMPEPELRLPGSGSSGQRGKLLIEEI